MKQTKLNAAISMEIDKLTILTRLIPWNLHRFTVCICHLQSKWAPACEETSDQKWELRYRLKSIGKWANYYYVPRSQAAHITEAGTKNDWGEKSSHEIRKITRLVALRINYTYEINARKIVCNEQQMRRRTSNERKQKRCAINLARCVCVCGVIIS